MVRIILLLITIIVFADKADKKQDWFKYEKQGYLYSLEFSTSLTIDSVLNVLYGFDHLEKYSSKISQTHFLSKKNENCYEFEIHLKHLFYASKSVYKRTIYPDSGIIKIELMRFRNNNSIFPSVTQSVSEYRVVENGMITEIQYKQAVSFNKNLNRFYSKIVKARLDEFADDLIRYIKNLQER